MAVYKVIQDIEAEDKIVGFLTLKTFIYALIAGALAYINIRLVMAGQLGAARWFIALLFLFPMLLFGVLALPLGREQPTEVWLLSRVRFFIKPRIRVWNQSGILEYVTITAPKKVERILTKNFTQSEVRSRLKALSTTLDSRGWAVKNVAVDLSANPSYLDITNDDSDRLIAASTLQQDQPVIDVHESDDIMDEQNNATAQHFENLMQQQDAKRKQQITQMINQTSQEQPAQEKQATEPADYGFLDKISPMNDKGDTTFVSHKVVTPGIAASDDDQAQTDNDLADAEKQYLERERKKAEEVHAKSIGFKPPGQKEPEPAPPKSTTMTTPAQTAKLEELAQSGSDLSVASVAHLANHVSGQVKQLGPNEVEIDLH